MWQTPLVVLVGIFGLAHVARQRESAPEESDELEGFLKDYTREDFAEIEALHVNVNPLEWRIVYHVGWADLDGDGAPEAVVQLLGRIYCGTGGCPLLVLQRDDDSFRVVSESSVTHSPVRVLDRREYGWRSLSVHVAEGGIAEAYEAELPFDGSAYPGNASVAPARKLIEEVAGEVLIPETADLTNGKQLYP